MTKTKDDPVIIVVASPTDTHDDIVRAVKSYLDTGVPPENVILQPFEEWTAIGRVADCDCNLLQCVCTEARKHKKDCLYRLAMTCAVPIACEHGSDVCPICEPCKCKENNAQDQAAIK